MLSYGYKVLSKFPRRDNALKNRIINTLLDMQDLVCFIKYAPSNENKYMLVVQLDQKLACLRKLIRFANNKNNYNKVNIPLGNHSYEVWNNLNKEIGLMINGLIKHIAQDLKIKNIIFNQSTLQKSPYINPNLKNPNPSINMNDVREVQDYLNDRIIQNIDINKEISEESIRRILKDNDDSCIDGDNRDDSILDDSNNTISHDTNNSISNDTNNTIANIPNIISNTNISMYSNNYIPPIPDVPDISNTINIHEHKSLEEVQEELNAMIANDIPDIPIYDGISSSIKKKRRSRKKDTNKFDGILRFDINHLD